MSMHPHCRCSLAPYEDSQEYEAWLSHLENGGTTESWQSFKNSGGAKKTKGLSAKIGSDVIPYHEEPKLLKVIDYMNKQSVIKELKNFEKGAISESIETAYVITSSGKVYKCFGIEDRVFPDFDLKDELKGASVSHNHPIEESSYTFSRDDLDLFLEYDLEVLRGCDEKYTYEFTRDKTLIDSEPDDWMNFENYAHANIIMLAKERGIGYRRWKNE